jgi:uncharacterized protein (DUF2384 family)
MWKTNVIGVKIKPRTATAALDSDLAEIWAATPKTKATTVTVIPLSWARRKIEAPRIENELSERPVKMKKMISIPALVFGNNPTLANIAIIIHEGE